MGEKFDITSLTLKELEKFLLSSGEPKYRARQIFSWIHDRTVSSFVQMTDLPKTFRDHMESEYRLEVPDILSIHDSDITGSRKFLLELSDGSKVESVFLPEGNRRTVCLSSQVGCPLGCKFCATGKMGILRDLSTAEIVAQLYAIKREVKERITNVVFMGMGEPLLNYDAVLKAAELIHHEAGGNIGLRKITISTSGIAPRIRQFADEHHPYQLAFSLNATTDQVRTEIMPINRKHDLATCLDALEYYSSRSRQRVTVEYVLLPGVNNSREDAERLIKIVRRLRAKLNVIPFNPIPETPFQQPTQEEMEKFLSRLSPAIQIVTVRWSQGSDIRAACGQLFVQNVKKKSHLADKTQYLA
ncbi:MAG: 23S rRNA (adenine(2503)-C(2))-methyltransferase RlmN [Fidelibacterota bacterium]